MRGGQQRDACGQHAGQQLGRVRIGGVKVVDEQQARAICGSAGEVGGIRRQPADRNAPIVGQVRGGVQQRGPPGAGRTGNEQLPPLVTVQPAVQEPGHRSQLPLTPDQTPPQASTHPAKIQQTVPSADAAARTVAMKSTNVLKHAGPARAEVMVGCAESAVTIEVTDDGPGNLAPPALTGGQGLAGMRERVAVFGGELRAGPRPGGGFAVCAGCWPATAAGPWPGSACATACKSPLNPCAARRGT